MMNAKMNEDQWIKQLTAEAPTGPEVIAGIGEDCAVLDVGLPDRWQLLKTDVVVEGIHFDSSIPAQQVGRKALARALSDFAAMSGVPQHVLVTLLTPKPIPWTWIQEAYAGLYALARAYGLRVVGGETSQTPKALTLSITLSGYVEKDRCVFRKGAQPGDGLFVTGELGGSLDGKHLEFEPRIEQARWLTAHFPVRAMIDLSDGLATDLRRLLHASQVGAELLKEAIPIARAAKVRYREGRSPKPPLEAAMTDGEDFELLFAIPPGYAVALVDQWKAAFPEIRLSCIGKIVAQPTVTIRSRKTVRPLNLHGYDHLQNT